MSGKVVILTGASRGIGLAIAHYLLKAPQSCKLLVCARSEGPLNELQKQYPGQVSVLAGDLGDFSFGKKAVDQAIDKWGVLDGLIVNHGRLEPVKRFSDCTAEEVRDLFDVNFFSAVAFVKAALPPLRKSKGCILFTSSGVAIHHYSSWGAYGASKAAMNNFAGTLAVEEPDVTTIAIRPGVVDTEMQRAIREEHQSVMDEKDVFEFKYVKEQGLILKPEQPGHVMARLILNAPKELSGKFYSWNDPILSAFQEDKAH